MTYVGATADPIEALGAAIEAKDGRFAKGFNELTAACNACHEGIGRGFIVIQVPTASPFSDQSFVRRRSSHEAGGDRAERVAFGLVTLA